MALQDPLVSRLFSDSPCVHAIIYTRIVYFNECVSLHRSYRISSRLSHSASAILAESRARRDARRHTSTSTVPFRVFAISNGSANAPGKHVCLEIGSQKVVQTQCLSSKSLIQSEESTIRSWNAR